MTAQVGRLDAACRGKSVRGELVPAPQNSERRHHKPSTRYASNKKFGVVLVSRNYPERIYQLRGRLHAV